MGHIDRMKTELHNLKFARNNLVVFIAASPEYVQMGLQERKLVNRQLDAMTIYRDVLTLRIERNGGK